MAFVSQTERLWSELASIASDEGLALYDCERTGRGGLRVFVSSAAGQVTSGDCSRLCRRLMSYFSVEGGALGLSSEPEIEVSSPGINRHLRLKEHFVAAVGERVRFGVRGEVESEGEKSQLGSLLGKLERASDEEMVVHDERTRKLWRVKFDQVSKANVDFDFREGSKR